MTHLSVIVITKNEGKNIRPCLESIRWASEIVLVDAGSTDTTVNEAKEFTDKIFVRPWDGFGRAKNFALQQCSHEWVLWIDADERVTPHLEAELRNALSNDDPQITAFDMPRKANFLGKWIMHCGWYPGRVTRLFRRSKCRFSERPVHESLEVEGRVGSLKSDILHYTDPNLFHYFEKFNRYTSLAAEELQEGGRTFRLLQLVINPAWVFFRMYVLKRGFLDGVQGFILCVLSSCYVFTKYAKHWELSSLEYEVMHDNRRKK
ncbi:MAG: glycosyltransferase family 2 protein [Ignavibacteriales bacterium]|nr:glycosyltransferase family 2 protein [Ignavibacteriales bacterium]